MERIELINRRKKVYGLYLLGFNLIDIARYFEVPTSSIRKSLSAMNINENITSSIYHDKKQLDKIESILDTRETSSDPFSTSILSLGFWKSPSAYTKNSSLQEVQAELRCIGITPDEIQVYLNIKNIIATRSHKNPISMQQKELAKILLSSGWSIMEISEFIGLALGKFADRKRLEKSALQKEEKQLLKKQIYMDYKAGMKQKDIVAKYNITRRCVNNYLTEYCENINLDIETLRRERKNLATKRKRTSKDQIISGLLDHLIINDSGEIVFKETLEKAALAIGCTEVSVSKYKKLIEENRSIYFKDTENK